MTAIAPTTDRPTWQAHMESNVSASFFVSARFPSETLDQALLERLVQRSNAPTGFDRGLLKRLNAEVWGTDDE